MNMRNMAMIMIVWMLRRWKNSGGIGVDDGDVYRGGVYYIL